MDTNVSQGGMQQGGLGPPPGLVNDGDPPLRPLSLMVSSSTSSTSSHDTRSTMASHRNHADQVGSSSSSGRRTFNTVMFEEEADSEYGPSPRSPPSPPSNPSRKRIRTSASHSPPAFETALALTSPLDPEAPETYPSLGDSPTTERMKLLTTSKYSGDRILSEDAVSGTEVVELVRAVHQRHVESQPDLQARQREFMRLWRGTYYTGRSRNGTG
ncbi:hypothetical protein BCR33DRAFT_720401 [Rhizoclosmatium globosum]|uniref:Uncharacterized protein n=1 Tax=Rhizoclosmatium globosum TaxID=329046 RepID=A0A1Y2BWP6_9FUNG|nr:hypothetical protein BCR33DRAFT_720401 [Rhizoclosmatium globosum]|eukprot:ORY39168.1 hypothetical protein BCR33DRAFT_720401 [Rhizoclosmatium globosum]